MRRGVARASSPIVYYDGVHRRAFCDTVDSLLRTRLLSVVQDPTHELFVSVFPRVLVYPRKHRRRRSWRANVLNTQFESTRPSEYRKTHCDRIEFSNFLQQSPETLGSEVARFTIPTTGPQYLPLEDDEAFGAFILSWAPLLPLSPSLPLLTFPSRTSVHIRRVETPEEDDSPAATYAALLTPPHTPPPFLPAPLHWALSSASVVARPPRSLPITPSSTPPRGPPSVSFSLSLAEGLERLYRSWFESPSASSSAVPQTKTHELHPTGEKTSAALRSARIECVQVPPTMAVPYGSSAYGSGYEPMRQTLFEFAYTGLEMDVGRLVVGVEEGMDREESRGPIVLWMTN